MRTTLTFIGAIFIGMLAAHVVASFTANAIIIGAIAAIAGGITSGAIDKSYSA